MAMGINTNIMSLSSQNALSKTNSGIERAMERLSTGLRINSAKDDAAGLGITDRMTSQVRGLNQAIRNAGDGISLAQTAEGAMQESTNILQRMRELAIQSANDSNSALDRSNLQKEISQLQQELSRIAETTTFNGKKILDGTFSAQKFHVGSNANETISVSVGSIASSDLGAYKLDGGSMTAAAAAAANTNAGDANGLTITGTLGTGTTAVVAANATASTVADAVNGVTASTGVTASASTTATLGTLSATGTVSFTLSNNDGGSASVSATLASTSDLGALADAINAVAATTGTTAAESGGTITLTNENGDDISIQDFTHSTATATMAFTGGSGSADTLTGNGTDDSTVGGQVTFTSSSTFTVETAATIHDASVTFSNVSSIDIGTQSGSNLAIDVIDGALQYVSNERADLGAIQNRLDSTISNLSNIVENVSAARSRIQDADFAVETANLTRGQILQQAGVAMLAQANAAPQAVLALLQ
jgi:flagellin